MKLYQYDDLKKTNQALGSFKRNGIPVIDVNHMVVDGKVLFLVLTDSVEKPVEKKVKENGKAEKKTENKKAKVPAGVKASGEGEASVDAKEAPTAEAGTK